MHGMTEEISRIEREADGLTESYSTGGVTAMKLLAGLKAHEPRMEALELFSGGLSADFAGPARQGLLSLPRRHP